MGMYSLGTKAKIKNFNFNTWWITFWYPPGITVKKFFISETGSASPQPRSYCPW